MFRFVTGKLPGSGVERGGCIAVAVGKVKSGMRTSYWQRVWRASSRRALSEE